MHRTTMLHRSLLASGGVCASLLLAACASDNPQKSGSISAADFRSPDAATATASMTERRVPSMRVEELPLETDAGGPFTVVQGAPNLSSDPAPVPTSGQTLMMDALIGDINGTPVYASTFFSLPIEARLNGIASQARNNRARWNKEAMEVIGGKLGEMVRDEVLLAEARASLSPEQKQGLLSFIEQVRRDLVSRGGGGKAAVDESLRAEGGLEAKLKENIDRQLVYANIREKILPRASVSWHDVQVEYERRTEKFNPDPSAYFRMIWLPKDKPELVEQFKSDLAAGTEFEDVASREENDFSPEKGGAADAQVFKGDYSKAELFGPAELNVPARTLQAGKYAGPIDWGRRVVWIYLDRIETPQAKSIYEAQLAIYNELRERKLKTESDRYLKNLLDQQSYTKLSDMADKLLVIATERYFLAPR